MADDYDYGYGDAAPDSEKYYGYGDAAPDSSSAAADMYGYGDAAPDPPTRTKTHVIGGQQEAEDPYGYGEAAPDSDAAATAVSARARASAADKYGYGEAAPDQEEDPYGYGPAAPDGQEGEGGDVYQSTYNDKVGGGATRGGRAAAGGGGGGGGANDMQPDPRQRFRRNPRSRSDDAMSAATVESYGDYGSGSSDENYANANHPNDEGHHDAGADGQPPRRQRYRRRGSVTKYSLDTAQDTVQQEYNAHSEILNQYRTQAMDMVPANHDYGQPSAAAAGAGAAINGSGGGADDPEEPHVMTDGEEDSFLQSPGRMETKDNNKKHQKKKNRFRRFTMGL